MPRQLGRVLFFAGLLLAFSSACVSTSASGKAGASCSNNSDCSTGLSCIGLATFSDAGCSATQKACSKTCATNSDCASLGSKFQCFSGCPGSPMFCVATP